MQAAPVPSVPWEVARGFPGGIMGSYLRLWPGEGTMAHSGALVEVLKRELKARGVKYADLARHLRLSEASVKRMFSRHDFTLSRLDEICRCAKIDFSELARAL